MSEFYWNDNYLNNPGPDVYDGWLDKYALSEGERVLDLGCGAGTNITFLLGRKARVTAADLSENAVRLVKECFGDQISADCFDMRLGFPYTDGSFDVVAADLSLHYFSCEDTRRIIGDIARILRSGGRLIARVHSMENLPADAQYIAPGYYRAYGCDRRYFTLEDVRDLFAGWRLECGAGIARRYGQKKRIIELMAVCT